MVYARPWQSFQQQLELLKSRGMQATDEPAALRYLERIGYYRLSAYWYPFRKFSIHQDPATKVLVYQRQNEFEPNTQFIDSVNLYLFDKKLRLHVLDALERIEVALRVDIAYLLGQKDTFAYKNIGNFHPKFANKINRKSDTAEHQAWLAKYQSLCDRSKEDFVAHYLNKHGPDLPIWVAIELWDFGALSQLFAMMKVPDQSAIAIKYGVNDFKVFASWLRSLNYLRNLAAHHSRLWNRNVIDQPKLPAEKTIAWCDEFIGKNDLIAKPFLLLAITNHLIKKVCPNTAWNTRVKTHLLNFPQLLSDKKLGIESIGVVQYWQDWW